MRAYIIGSLVVVGALLIGSQATAHHSFAAEFDRAKPVTLTGIVTKVDWTNPHVWFYINVKDKATGKVTNCGAEMGPPHMLQGQGWRRDTLKAGQEVTIKGSLAKNGTNRLNASTVTVTATGGSPRELDAASSGGTGEAAKP